MLPAKGVHIKDFKTEYFVIVLAWATTFSFNGGYINAIAFAGVWKAGLSHLTGSVTNSAVKLLIPPTLGGWGSEDLIIFILGFGLGSFTGGLVLGPPRLKWGRLQGFLLLLMGLSILGSFFAAGTTGGGMLLSYSMGMQNSITSNFTPLTIRTSHVTGTIVDLGMCIGQMIHMRTFEYFWKIKVHIPTFLAFWIGAFVGTYSYLKFDEYSLLLSAFVCIVIGVLTLIVYTYMYFYQNDEQKQVREEIKRKEKELADVNLQHAQSVYQLHQKLHRSSKGPSDLDIRMQRFDSDLDDPTDALSEITTETEGISDDEETEAETKKSSA
eukprot:TRINITY_DN7853_c0_g1_i1.p1 TRINITY_DN7853_c0_g1~~TRINITY_DN7853_c0_g1_i1.p1  ORF type:complete len:325 (-),score=48.95 TRINITY_DN7853_c0_g1_i1:46-1020(-)